MGGRIKGLVLCGLVAAGLSACAAPGEGPAGGEVPSAPAGPLVERAQGSLPTLATLPMAVRAPTAVVRLHEEGGPGQLVGLDGRQVAALLGQPDFHRRDEPAQVWQYLDPSCLLDLFLYRQGESYRVVRYDIRNRTIARIGAKKCFQSLLRSHTAARK